MTNHEKGTYAWIADQLAIYITIAIGTYYYLTNNRKHLLPPICFAIVVYMHITKCCYHEWIHAIAVAGHLHIIQSIQN